VTPEYNYGPPASLINALDYLYTEWNYKPAGFVSYGGISGGLRSVEVTKQVVATLKMMPIPEGVPIPLVSQLIGTDGAFAAGDLHEKSVTMMLDELVRWAEALRVLRAPQ
jgi:NAD(P)H-dependent FMN reductase